MKKDYYRACILFLFFIITPFIKLYAQQPQRVEIEINNSTEQYGIAPIGKNGLIIFFETGAKENGKRIWEFRKYNNDFKQKWKIQYPVIKKLEFQYYHFQDPYIYVFLSREKFKAEFQVVRLNVNTKDVISSTGKLPDKVQFNSFKVLDNHAFFGGETTPTTIDKCGKQCLMYFTCCLPVLFGEGGIDSEAMAFNVDVGQNGYNILPLTFEGSSSVSDIHINRNEELAEITIANRPEKKVQELFLKKYNKESKLVNSIKVKPGNNNQLLNGKVVNLDGDRSILLGSFATPLSSQKGSIFKKIKRATQGTSFDRHSNGLYFSKFEDDQQKYIKYYKFKEFNSFTNRSEKLKRNNDEKEYEINKKLLINDLVKSGDEYIVVAEAYYPEYETRMSYDPNTGNYTSREVFVGYRYTHAIIAGFDMQGNLLWDNTITIGDILTMELEPRVKILTEGHEIILVYSNRGKLKSKIIKGNQLVADKQETDIATFKGDEQKRNYESNVEYWYNNFFIAYGRMKVKDEDSGWFGGRRKVFYFNKVAYK